MQVHWPPSVLHNLCAEPFPQLFRVAYCGRERQELNIKADKQVPHGVVVEIMNIAFKAGIHSVNLATRPDTPMTMAP